MPRDRRATAVRLSCGRSREGLEGFVANATAREKEFVYDLPCSTRSIGGRVRRNEGCTPCTLAVVPLRGLS